MSLKNNKNDSLEKGFSNLNLEEDLNIESFARTPKIPPAVPPKKKAQPQVPHSSIVSNLRGPSYSTRISPASCSNSPAYSNALPSYAWPIEKKYANVSINAPSIQTSRPLPPHPQNTHSTNHIPTYSNVASFNNKNDDELPPPPPPPPLNAMPNQYNAKEAQDDYLPPPSPVSSNYSELARATANLSYNQERTNYPPIYQNEYPVYGSSQGSTYESLYEPINPRPQSAISAQTVDSHQIHNNKTLPKEEEVDALTNLLVKSISDSQDLGVFGMCIRCNEKVKAEKEGCTAMGNLYHVTCFCCYHCNSNLQGKPFYAVEGQPYCETDYYETLEKCSVCEMPILDRILRATGKPYHPACFTCVMCGKSLDGIPFTVDAMNQNHCIEDFHKKFAPRCCVCELPIMPEDGEEETVRVVALDRSFHVRCYRCEDCGLRLSSEAEGRGCYPLDDHILCKNCNAHRVRLLTNVMTTDL